MRQIIEIDAANQRAVVEPGVANLVITAAGRTGTTTPPTRRASRSARSGGNVAENSGGAHCLKYGFTTNHVTGLELVTPEGELTWLGDGTGARPATT